MRLASLAALTLLLCLSVPGDVKADWVLTGLDIGDKDDDFDYVEHFRDSVTGEHLVWYWGKDGTSFGYVFPPGNPDPDGTSSGPKGDLQSRIALAKQKGGGNWLGQREFWDSPLGRSLASKGKGPGPVINPGDDNAGGGPGDPSRGKEKLGGPLIIDKTGMIGSGKGDGFQFDAGSPADQLNKPGGPGGNQGGGGSNDDDDKGSHKPPPGSNFGPVELVDPLGPPIARPIRKGTGMIAFGALGGPDTKSRKGKSGEGLLPYIEQKSPKTNSGKMKGSERGVIAIIKPGDKTGIGNAGFKGKGQGALGGPDTKGVRQYAFGGTPGANTQSWKDRASRPAVRIRWYARWPRLAELPAARRINEQHRFDGRPRLQGPVDRPHGEARQQGPGVRPGLVALRSVSQSDHRSCTTCVVHDAKSITAIAPYEVSSS